MNGYDGSSSEYVIPTPHALIRPGFEDASCPAGISNIFVQSGITNDGSMKMNRRYCHIDRIFVKPSTGAEIEIPCNIRPDSRDQFFTTLSFAGTGADASTVNKVVITGHINFDQGEMTIQGTVTADASATLTYSFASARVKVRFVPVNTMRGRTVVKLTNEINIDSLLSVVILK